MKLCQLTSWKKTASIWPQNRPMNLTFALISALRCIDSTEIRYCTPFGTSWCKCSSKILIGEDRRDRRVSYTVQFNVELSHSFMSHYRGTSIPYSDMHIAYHIYMRRGIALPVAIVHLCFIMIKEINWIAHIKNETVFLCTPLFVVFFDLAFGFSITLFWVYQRDDWIKTETSTHFN